MQRRWARRNLCRSQATFLNVSGCFLRLGVSIYFFCFGRQIWRSSSSLVFRSRNFSVFVGTAYRTETVKLIRQSSIDLCRVFWWSFASFHWRFRLFYLALLVDWGPCFYSGYHCSLRLFPDVASTGNNKVFSSVQTCSLLDVNVGACLVTAVWSLVVSPHPYPTQQKQDYFPRHPPPTANKGAHWMHVEKYLS